MYFNIYKIFLLFFTCFLLFGNSVAEYKSFIDYFKASNATRNNVDAANIIRVNCNKGYMYINKKCRKVFG